MSCKKIKSIFIYIKTNDENSDIIKIFYPKKNFVVEFDKIKNQLIVKFIFLSMIALVIASIFSFYSLSPLRKSYMILKEFIKDIIHDINTPLSVIKLNLSLIDDKDDEVLTIQQSVNTLEMLHKNLNNYLNSSSINLAEADLKDIIEKQTDFFSNIYDWLDWQIDIEDATIINNSLVIQNSSYGIKKIDKIFDRFYKESDRGLGIGLHIVSKFLKQLNYKYSIDIDKKKYSYF